METPEMDSSTWFDVDDRSTSGSSAPTPAGFEADFSPSDLVPIHFMNLEL
jgi:hypothetical protein